MTESPSARRLIATSVVLVCTGVALLAAEIAVRLLDGYRIAPVRLEPASAQRRDTDATRRPESRKWLTADDVLSYARRVPVAQGVAPEWFEARLPERPDWRAEAELVARANRYRSVGIPADYEWNWNYVVGAMCRSEHNDDAALFEQLDDLYVFEPSDGSDAPRYRFLRNATYPSGLVTNDFGWRGPAIPLEKAPRTIRLAFVGASTTVGFHAEPFSYPELVGLWLNRWAEANHLGVSFDAINAGREGVNSSSIQAIVKQELLPVEPDLVVYYEGANQFWPADFVTITVPSRSRISLSEPGFGTAYSALARRVDTVVRRAELSGSEPSKPPLPVRWPADLSETDPDLANPRLPYESQHVLGDLERMRTALQQDGGRLAISSFVWLVHPGLVLDPVRDALIFSYLNTTYWPFSYAHMRRFLDFQTRVFQKYAAAHDVDFIDLASRYPQDPRLFADAIHIERAGLRLQAWLVFNGLVPFISRRLVSQEWPRPARHAAATHPAFSSRRKVTQSEIRAACNRQH